MIGLRHRKVLVQRISSRFELVDRLGFLDVSIPIIEVGKGKKVLTLICGVHGNESATLFVVDEVLKKLPKSLRGMLRIVINGNPLAFAEDKRASSIDSIDINRIFPGNASRTITHRTANRLIDLLRDSEAIIDLHTFSMHTPLMGIIVNPEENFANIELMRVFSPKQAWVIQSKKRKESKFGMSLGAALNNLMIPNIAVEIDRNASEDIIHCADGILRVMNNIGMMNVSAPPGKGFLSLDRCEFLSGCNGLFFPGKNPLSEVRKGETIGIIRDLLTQEDTPVVSDRSGFLMQISSKRFVRIGDDIFAVGQEVQDDRDE